MGEVIFAERASKGIVKEYYALKQSFIAERSVEAHVYKTLLNMAEVDPVLSTALDLTVDLTTQNGYTFSGENQRTIKEVKKLFDDKLDFDQVIDNILYQLLIFGDAYLELRRNESGTKIMELHALETSEMDFEYDKHGEILQYVQKVESKGKENWVYFKPKDVIYFRLRRIGSEMKSKVPFKSVARDFTTNLEANNYLLSIFKNLPPKLVYFLKSSNDKNRKDLIENLLKAKSNPNIDIIMQGEADAKVMEVNFNNGLMQVLQWIQNRVLMITRVPPHWIGIMDGANRGIGENVVISYETKIRKLQTKIASRINKELMPKLGFPNITFKWNAISLMDEKETILNMGQLKTIGFDNQTVIQYGKDHGLKMKPDAKIIEQPVGPQIQNETAPTRQSEGKFDKMSDELNQKGVSDAGKKKLEAKQLVKE